MQWCAACRRVVKSRPFGLLRVNRVFEGSKREQASPQACYLCSITRSGTDVASFSSSPSHLFSTTLNRYFRYLRTHGRQVVRGDATRRLRSECTYALFVSPPPSPPPLPPSGSPTPALVLPLPILLLVRSVPSATVPSPPPPLPPPPPPPPPLNDHNPWYLLSISFSSSCTRNSARAWNVVGGGGRDDDAATPPLCPHRLPSDPPPPPPAGVAAAAPLASEDAS